MANRAYIVPRRNDLAGMGIYLADLKPNAGQRNSVYDGESQNVYVAEGLDFPGTTVVSGISYLSGSLNTTLAADAVADDTTGGGNDVTAMAITTFGLAAYLKDRVHSGGKTAPLNGELAFATCNTVAQNIRNRVGSGLSLTLADINTLLAAAVANTELASSVANSKSFGSVEDILRILSGEVYRLPALTIIENVAGQFRSLAERTVFVSAQTAAQVASQGQFYASGGFLSPTDSGFRRRPELFRTGALNISAGEGVLAGYKTNLSLFNPAFAYTAADVKAWTPRAYLVTGSVVPTTGEGPFLSVYDHLGNVL